jgi:hypothetical protein
MFKISDEMWNDIQTRLLCHLLLVDLFPTLTGTPKTNVVKKIILREGIKEDDSGELYTAV